MMIFAVKAEQFTNSATRWCLIMMIFLQQYVIAGGAIDWDFDGISRLTIALHEYSDKYKPLLSGDESRGPQSSIVITITMMIKEYK